MTQENHTLLEKHILKNDIECGYKRAGSYLVAFSKKELNDIDESIKLLNRDGFRYKKIEKGDIKELLSNKGFFGVAFNAFDGEINPVRLVRGLVKVANNKGVYIFENTPVKKIERSHNSFKIRTKHGVITADYVVLATNAYTPLIHPYFRNVIKPVRGQILVTNPCRTLFDGVFYGNYGYEYWRQLPDGRILAGGFRETDPVRETGYRMITTKKIQNKLEGLLHKLSVKSKVAYRWSGIMAFTKDRLPVIGSIPNMKNFLVSAGYSGHGLGFSFIAGKMISEEILYNKSSKMFSPARSF